MSSLPVLLNDILDDFTNELTLGDQNFGLGVNTIPRLAHVPLYAGYLRAWRNIPTAKSGISVIENNKNEFKVNLDVQQFKPLEINVKLQDDYLVVEGKHEERKDKHGYISRQFQRRYKLPENVEQSQIKSTLSSDGILTLQAPKIMTETSEERDIPVEVTDTPALDQAEDEPHSENEEYNFQG